MASTCRDRYRKRKYLSGSQKRALAKVEVAKNEMHGGAIKNFLSLHLLRVDVVRMKKAKNIQEMAT